MEFRDPSGAVGGSSAAAEVAAVLKDEPGRWAAIEEHPLPTMEGNPDIDLVREALSGVDLPARAAALADVVSDSAAAKLLSKVAKSDAKVAEDRNHPIRFYASVGEVLKAVLAELTKLVRARASSRTGVIKDGRVKAFLPAGTFGAKSETEVSDAGVRQVTVYARYLGEEYALPAEEQPDAKRRAKKDAAERPPAFPVVAGGGTAEGVVE